ncbi:MAG: hypothetical protein JOY64_14565 [Alphaproteobacteria bacterium]|nr:hypothetical protein [Alphaproteobacteria bacterium]MBV8408853.1 hypothetical protein [Alphaproteobacteria bacterium]
MIKGNITNVIAGVSVLGLCLSVLVIGVVAVHKPARANAYAQEATGYQCKECHQDVSLNVTRQGLTSFGRQWQDNKCPTKQGNLCGPK